MYSGKSIIYKMDIRRKEAEGFINTGKCQDTRATSSLHHYNINGKFTLKDIPILSVKSVSLIRYRLK